MPLYDHFHPPWKDRRPWEGVHGAWATAIAFHLNSGLLPAEYFALPLVRIGGRVEVDVATIRETEPFTMTTPAGTALWAPPRPTLEVPIAPPPRRPCGSRSRSRASTR